MTGKNASDNILKKIKENVVTLGVNRRFKLG